MKCFSIRHVLKAVSKVKPPKYYLLKRISNHFLNYVYKRIVVRDFEIGYPLFR